MKNTVLFEEMKDSLARAIARVGAIVSFYETSATERVVSFVVKRNLEAEVKWYDDPECRTEEDDKALWMKVVVGGYDIVIRTLHVNEKFLIDVRGITDPKTPLEICYNLNGISDIWYRGIAKEDLPTEVDKFLCDILEVI